MTYKPWPTADQQQQEQGRTDVVGNYILNPATGQPYDNSSPMPVSSSGGGGGGAMTVADGADVAQGTTTDTANVNTVIGQLKQQNVVQGAAADANTTNTVMGRLTKLRDIFADVWDSVNHRLHVSVDNANATGQATMANSAPVVIASDQTKIPTYNGGVVLYSTSQSGISATADSGDIDVSKYTRLLLIANLTAFTGTSIQFRIRTADAFSTYYNFASPAALTTAGAVIASIGDGALTYGGNFGNTVRVQWVCTSVTSATFTVTLYGK